MNVAYINPKQEDKVCDQPYTFVTINVKRSQFLIQGKMLNITLTTNFMRPFLVLFKLEEKQKSENCTLKLS